MKVGNRVKSGDVIGHLGNTGNTSALAFAFSRDGRAITLGVKRSAL